MARLDGEAKVWKVSTTGHPIIPGAPCSWILRTDKQLHAQPSLPLTLIPIRIDLDVPSFTPTPALPLPTDALAFGINPALPAYKPSEPTPAYRLKDVFMWNLHETLITPEQFAQVLVNELDLPSPATYALEISKQIRQQLEEYAGVAMHPLFHSTNSNTSNETTKRDAQASKSREESQTPGVLFASTPTNVDQVMPAVEPAFRSKQDGVTATATAIPSGQVNPENPDDTYRCLISLNINLLNKLFQDKFEWSLLHPPGVAEIFAKQTCADMGLTGEWVPAIAHAIHEAVLRLKKDACENGGLVGGNGYGGELENLAYDGHEAGWRYDNENLAYDFQPKLETLSKEEIEKREGDRERQIRRLRRETARFSSTSNMAGGAPTLGYFDQPENPETPLGRGERSKKKRRFRSLSPTGRSGTPGGLSEAAGYGGGGSGPSDWYVLSRALRRVSLSTLQGKAVLALFALSRSWFRCVGCARWAIRAESKSILPLSKVHADIAQSLCHNCGLSYERDRSLPPWSKALHRLDNPIATR